MSEQRRTAFVSGASRGIGRATAIALARNGFDLGITARTVNEGDHELSGSLNDTAAKLEAQGAKVLMIPMDLSDREAVAAAADTFLDEFGHIDLLVNNGVYQSPGANEMLFLDTPIEEMAKVLEGNVIAPAVLCQKFIPSMIENGGGTIMNMSSASVYNEPPGTVHEDGWSLAYVASKGGIDRFASILNVELRDKGIRTFLMEPGAVCYGERLEDYIIKYPNVPVSPPEACAEAIVWLMDSPDSEKLIKKRIYLPAVAHKNGLLADWDGPGTVYPKPN